MNTAIKSTNHAVTDNNVIVAKGSKKLMLRKRADLAAENATPDGFEQRQENGRRRFDVWLSITGQIGDTLS